MTIQPLKTRDLLALSVLAGGIVSVAAAAEGLRSLAALAVLAAALLDVSLAPRLAAGARWSRFNKVLLDICRQVPFGLAPSFAVYLAFRAGADAGGPGWGIAPAAILASLPCALGCVRFTRDDILVPRLAGVRFGPSQAMVALAMMGLVHSHLFAGRPFIDARAPYAPFVFAAGALLLLWLSLQNLSLAPGPERAGRRAWDFAGLLVVAAAAGGFSEDAAAAADVLAAGLTLALPMRSFLLPPDTRRAAREASERFRKEWREQQGPKSA
ncbi:MAG: hypothetical protein GYA21_17940 [Myxococcales bacterium]|nr:hypothetical protein [Myxococcales bacterium]